MPRCPNCNYLLVLLEHRRKYKCAKCGKLFPQKEIDDAEYLKEFRKVREEARKQAARERDKSYREENKEKIKAWTKENYQKNREKILAKRKEKKKPLTPEQKEKAKKSNAEWRKKNPERVKEGKRKYWAKHREHLLKKRKENYEKRKPEILARRRLYRQNNSSASKTKHLQETQRQLESKNFEIEPLKRYNHESSFELPTLALS